MKIKKIKVQIRPLKMVLKEAAEVMYKVKNRIPVKPSRGLNFPDVESFRKFFTPKRLELLKVIKHKQPGSIYELASLTNRDVKSVDTDIKILEEYGLIDTKKIPVNNSYKVKPIFDYDRLDVEIDI